MDEGAFGENYSGESMAHTPPSGLHQIVELRGAEALGLD